MTTELVSFPEACRIMRSGFGLRASNIQRKCFSSFQSSGIPDESLTFAKVSVVAPVSGPLLKTVRMPYRPAIHTKGYSPEARRSRSSRDIERRTTLRPHSDQFIGTGEARAWFKGKARISISPQDLRSAIAANENVAAYYFLFVHGTTLDQEDVNLAKQAGIPLVVSINTDHYAGKDEMIAAHANVEKALQLGVTDFRSIRTTTSG